MTARQELDNDMGRSCNVCINAHITCTWPPGKRRACFECTRRHDKCLIDGESVTQRAPHGSRPKKKRARIVSQPAIEEVIEEAAVEELAWVTLQEVCKLCESAERHEHFEFGIWDELRKLVTLKGREVALAQGNIVPMGVAQERAAVGKIQVPGKGKRRARELEEEEETMV